MLEDYTISELPEKYAPTKNESKTALRNAIKKLVLQKPNILLGCHVADEIRQEIKQEEADDE